MKKYPENTRLFFCSRCGINADLIEVVNLTKTIPLVNPRIDQLNRFKYDEADKNDDRRDEFGQEVVFYKCAECGEEYNTIFEHFHFRR